MENQAQILFYLLFIPQMLFALSAHEAAHAGTASWLGDDTARLLGRVTLNPLKHIDPIGLVAFFIIHFGWAKPVPINPLRLKHPRRDAALIGFAGPASNLFLGVLLLFIIRGLWITVGPETEAVKTALAFLFVGAQLNVGLCFFNLIPIPPLDGSHILLGLLPDSVARSLDPVMRQGWIILIVLLVAGRSLGFSFFGTVIGKPMALVFFGVLGDSVSAGVLHILADYNLF